MLLIEATADSSFTVVCPVLGSEMRFAHFLEPSATGVHVTHEVRFSGWLAGALMKSVGNGLVGGLPITMQRLRNVCEARG